MPFFGKSGTSRISFFSPSQSTGLVDKLSSSNLKRTKCRDRVGFGFFSALHARRSRTFLQSRPQLGQLVARSHGQHFDAAVIIVAFPSGNLQDVRLAFGKPSEANTLDTSAHEKAASLDGRLFFFGSHRQIA